MVRLEINKIEDRKKKKTCKSCHVFSDRMKYKSNETYASRQALFLLVSWTVSVFLVML